MATAPRDQNNIPTLLGVSNVDGTTPVIVYADPVTHRLLVDLPSGSGTVTSVSVATANGFAGTVTNPTTTPQITLQATPTGILQSNGTALSAITVGSGLTFAAGTLSASGGTGTVTSVSVVTANGVSGSVATATTTPAITLTLGAITPTSVNGLTFTANATGFSIAGGTSSKTLTINNSLTFAGTDGSTLNIGAGGTLGSAAFTAASAYEVPLTFSTGLTRTVNTITVNASQIISTLSNLTSNGLVQTTGGTGALSILSMGTGIATFLGTPSSANLAAAITDETGSGALVFATTPTLVTPVLGVATATSINKVTITAPATGATLTIADGSTLATSGAFACTLTLTAATNVTLPISGTLYGTLSGSITSAQLATSLTDETGTGSNVFANKPTFVGTINTIVAVAALALDGSLGSIFTKTIATGSTFTQSNFSTGQCFMLKITGAFTPTWWSGITWITTGGTAPTQAAITTYGFVCTGSNTFDGYVVGTQ